MKMLLIISWISVASSALPFTAGLYSLLKKKGDKALSIFSVYQILAFTVQLVMTVLALNYENNLFVVHTFIPVEFLFLIAFLQLTNKSNHKGLLWLVALAWIAITYDVTINTELSKYPTVALMIESMILFGISASSLIGLRDEKKYFGKVVIVIGLCVYYGANTFTFPCLNNYSLMATVLFHAVINIIANIIFTLGVVFYEYK